MSTLDIFLLDKKYDVLSSKVWDIGNGEKIILRIDVKYTYLKDAGFSLHTYDKGEILQISFPETIINKIYGIHGVYIPQIKHEKSFFIKIDKPEEIKKVYSFLIDEIGQYIEDQNEDNKKNKYQMQQLKVELGNISGVEK